MLGDPWHSGVLSSITNTTGFDARDSSLIVGTSAGSVTAVQLRAGASAHDLAAQNLGRPISAEGQEILGRVHTPWSESEGSRSFLPTSPRMAMRAIWPPWTPDLARLAIGLLPPGRRTADPLASRISELHPGHWASAPTWIVAVRTDDGNRVVFGRDDISADLGEAVQASCAVPGVYQPKTIGRSRYVDGGLHSSTNADLVASLGFDMVIISSVMTATDSARNPLTDPQRAWFSRKLDAEVNAIRRTGTPILVIEPGPDELPSLSKKVPDARAKAAELGELAAKRSLESIDGLGIRALLQG